ncbi:MAG: collagen-like protein, partial [Actinobacteria bacterium]|nr:collagen-like protein [Actinomycetota bacterium]
GTMHLKTPSTAKCPNGQKKVTWNVKGPRGATGAQGAPGQDGTDGVNGVDGSPGADGAKGDTGDAVLDTVNCSNGQTIVWNGTGWGCRTVAITGQLSITSVDPLIFNSVHENFDSYTPNVQNAYCDYLFCYISLTDVTDHQSCSVTVYGNSTAQMVDVRKNPTDIELRYLGDLTFGEPFYVNLSCLE